MSQPLSLRAIRVACAVVFVCGIAGIIVSSVNGNNEGWVISIGLTTTLAAIALIIASTVAVRQRIHVFDDVAAEQLEARMAQLIAAGADETALRDVVRQAIELGRRTS
ncbi:MAG: hypothetical protein RJB08_322 [Actinomycetota bacterium]|jgi:metal-dependent amidase/aminoacylase/carboxypeptidase family protein